MNIKKWIQTFVFVISFSGMAVVYQNCGSGSGTGGDTAAATAPGGDIQPIPNTKTASVQRASRVLDNLVSCMGVGEPRQSALNVYANARGTISEEGLATTLTQPMAKAMVTLSAEICDQLLDANDEAAQAARDRMFPQIDFAGDTIARNQLIDGAKRMSRACWGRNPTDTELANVVDDTSAAFPAGALDDQGNAISDQERVRRSVLFMCISMASSFSTYEM